jgi:Protein of unknown function (DUF1569)
MDQFQGGTPPANFASDLEDLRILLDRFCNSQGEFAPHVTLGQLSRTERMRHAYLHVDHHLRQFGVSTGPSHSHLISAVGIRDVGSGTQVTGNPTWTYRPLEHRAKYAMAGCYLVEVKTTCNRPIAATTAPIRLGGSSLDHLPLHWGLSANRDRSQRRRDGLQLSRTYW